MIASKMDGRNARQVRERWKHYLAPSANLKTWTLEDDKLLMEKYNELGQKWKEISDFFKGRTSTNIRNRVKYLLSAKNTSNETSPGEEIPNDPEKMTKIGEQMKERMNFSKDVPIEIIISHLRNDDQQEQGDQQDDF